jgi:hypothetical protein
MPDCGVMPPTRACRQSQAFRHHVAPALFGLGQNMGINLRAAKRTPMIPSSTCKKPRPDTTLEEKEAKVCLMTWFA